MFSTDLRDGTLSAYKVVGEESADYAKSVKIANELGGAFPTYQRLIPTLDEHPEDKQKVKGLWGYVDGVVTGVDGIRTWNEEGELVEAREEKNSEKLVRVFSGPSPFSVLVYSDYSPSGARYFLYPDFGPSATAPVVFLFRPSEEDMTREELLELRTAVKRVVPPLIAKLGSSADPEVLKDLQYLLERAE